METTINGLRDTGKELPDIAFSRWVAWCSRKQLVGIDKRGLYLLGHFASPPKGQANPLARQVVYIGETHGETKTLSKRWSEFNRAAFRRGDNHSGGENYRSAFGDAGEDLFVAAFPVGQLPEPLLIAFVLYVERKLILEYVMKWGERPKCNTE